ncbi:hypothetical protein EJ04DRAFT_453464, partial [Polyplosphaeria fusca]
MPLNPSVILDRFTNNTSEALGSRESSASVLSGEDWRKIERLVHSTSKDKTDKDTRLLSHSLHHISVQNQLLHDEVRGLREALEVKKKHKKQGKALELQQRKEYHSSAVFWSPRKVREARYRNAVTKREKKEQQLQKANTCNGAGQLRI